VDDSELDWEPLKQGLGSLTKKFPFSLPWDVSELINQFQGAEWDGIIDINIDKVGTFPVEWHFCLDFSMFDDIRVIAKKIELLFFDIGLIYGTRRLMGGGV